jgi:hypothetical protein
LGQEQSATREHNKQGIRMSNRFHVATRKGLFTFSHDGAGWQASAPAFLGEPVSTTLEDPRDGALYAALALGHFGPKLRRSLDGGSSWEEMPPPAFPPSDDPEAPSVSMIWTLATGGPDDPGVIYAGTIPAALFRSEDRGASWTLLSLSQRPERAEWFGGGFDHPGVHSVLVDPRDSRKLTVGISCGGVWKSDDRGETWRIAGKGLRAAFLPPEQAYYQNTQDPHLLSRCAAAPDVIWCQHHNGIFRSTDAGETFEEISTAFGFAVAAHPVDGGSAWFAPGVKDECRVPVDARLVVSRTRDGGRTFEAKSEGLPSGPSYDLIYRHALVADASGDRLAMGSTTGNLWVSETGADSWSLLSSHLPPIAHVSWA